MCIRQRGRDGRRDGEVISDLAFLIQNVVPGRFTGRIVAEISQATLQVHQGVTILNHSCGLPLTLDGPLSSPLSGRGEGALILEQGDFLQLTSHH